MWIQVRTMDGKRSAQVDNLSKLTKIEELRKKLEGPFEVPPNMQRLFFRGKQLEDGHTLFDYNVGLNEIVQLVIKTAIPATDSNNNGKPAQEEAKKSVEKESNDSFEKANGHVSNEDQVMEDVNNQAGTSKDKTIKSRYKKGEMVDAKDPRMGAWFEAKVMDISLTDENDPGSISYHVVFDGYEEDDVTTVPENSVRPVARTALMWDQISVGQVVMANYNPDEPDERGYWYDVKITKKYDGLTRNTRELYARLLLGTNTEDTVAQEFRLKFIDKEIFKIESPPDPSSSEEPSSSANGSSSPAKRQVKPDCSHCKDDPKKLCKHCACHKCGGKENPGDQLLCDECDLAYHIYCLTPPLTKIPEDDEWFCPLCKNDTSEVIHAGEKLRESKKKQKMASSNSTTNRDWGKGMACVGRTKICSIVPPNHFGPIPGVPVGSAWKFRVQVSEAGIHRPHVSGIHGRDGDGAYSIVLAGGYEDDLDYGDEFFYTGSGGRDLSGNKRTAEQSCDQTLTKMNRALAKNCAVPFNGKEGAVANNWKEGKAVRVVRSSKLAKHSKYAPADGNRYDGIYKVVKYWPEKGKSGFIVWRYLLRRDDETPAPWTKEGKKKIQELGLKMVYPEGYLEAQAKKEEEKKKQEKEKDQDKEAGKGKGKGKRKRDEDVDSPQKSPPTKKRSYKLPEKTKELLDADTANSKLWSEVTTGLHDYPTFIQKVEEAFTCICCQDVVCQPITTKCLHNICKSCLQRSFKAEVYCCPACRAELGKNYKLTMNTFLDAALNHLFPGYTKGR
ncbi:E3 ubiquitin-protein ligase UHRF1-like isoform X1 [Orbicella faveolata]|uniref:E3 ubiquitin-protein ligase UHRF1-like isoform X1 n=1 Tax=Orbicella faveolata TaxID=48498 RepID=UPI0009E56B98|nr:E3 ubiquitin-protein ligase UHRF1-like isoform X1 [Orbicella faveolata]